MARFGRDLTDSAKAQESAHRKRGRPAKPLSERLKRFLLGETGCHVWQGAKNSKGYGVILVSGGRNDRRIFGLAHRLQWEQHHGPVPDGLIVLHACDNPACINIEHLSVGTHRDNTWDAISKGRHNVSGLRNVGTPAQKAAHHLP